MATFSEGSFPDASDLSSCSSWIHTAVGTRRASDSACAQASSSVARDNHAALPVEDRKHGGGSAPSNLEGVGGGDTDVADLEEALRSMPKFIPCRYLYNVLGNDLYAKIVKLEEYYLFRTEVGMLEKHAHEISAHVPSGAVLVELGCGSATKTSIILRALLRRNGPDGVRYTGIDVLPTDVLDGTAKSLAHACRGLLPENISMVTADYSAGVKEARRMHPGAALCFIWLGSSIGNLEPSEAVDFFQDLLREGAPGTQLFLCADLWKSPEMLHSAYHDAEGLTEEFIRNGVSHALSFLRTPYALDPHDWSYEVVVNRDLHQVEMYLRAKRPINNLLPGVRIQDGERVLMEVSRKYTTGGLQSLAFRSGFHVQAQWCSRGYSMQMLLDLKEALSRCHAATDKLFAGVDDWDEKPIDLRHHFGFYFGHLAAFAAVKALREPGVDTRAEEDRKWDDIFLRGIDPIVLDPSRCHAHSEVPETWPQPEEVHAYVKKARTAVLNAISSDTCTARTAHFIMEHDFMHHETLAYMLAQRQRARFCAAQSRNSRLSCGSAAVPSGDTSSSPLEPRGCQQPGPKAQHGVLPPLRCQPLEAPARCPDGRQFLPWERTNPPSWDSVLDAAMQNVSPGGSPLSADSGARFWAPDDATLGGGVSSTRFVDVPGGEVVIGVDTAPASSFVWDLEGPPQEPINVSSFQAASAPVTMGEFYQFAVLEGGYARPELWEPCDFDFFRARGQTLPATWSSQDGEVFVHSPGSSRPLREVAHWPVWVSLAEARAFCRSGGARVMTEPEYQRLLDFDPDCKRVKQLRTGGWEWTDTLLEPFKGFEPMPEYPEYSTDFYDGQHYVLRGSSPFTPAPLRRDSFRNFFQRQYPYVFAKFRCCH